ncbi:MAG: hypothetical protein K1V71_06640, partial [Paramuribaculum sp.]
DITRTLLKSGIIASEFHSYLDQERRDEVMLGFRANHIDVLVATDILARGIDIDDIAMVINYEVPREAEDYVHRIGRTARAGQGGKAVTLVGPAEQPKFGQIERFLRYEVRKNDMPEHLGEAPSYDPSRRVPSGTGRSGGHRGGKQGHRGPGEGRRQGGGQRKGAPSHDKRQPRSQASAADPAAATKAATRDASAHKPRRHQQRNRPRRPKEGDNRKAAD